MMSECDRPAAYGRLLLRAEALWSRCQLNGGVFIIRSESHARWMLGAQG